MHRSLPLAVPRFGLALVLASLMTSCGGSAREDILGQGGSALGGAGDGAAGSVAGSGGSSGSGGAPHGTGGAGAAGTTGNAGTGGGAGTGGVSSAGAAGTTQEGDDHDGSGTLDGGVPRSNLTPDPSFESGHQGWSAFGPATISNVEGEAHSGASYIAATNRTLEWTGATLAVRTLVTPGTAYDVSAWVRLSQGSEMTTLSLKTACEGTTEEHTTLASETVEGEWTLLASTFTAPTCTLDDLRIYIGGPPAGVDIFVDDVWLLAVP